MHKLTKYAAVSALGICSFFVGYSILSKKIDYGKMNYDQAIKEVNTIEQAKDYCLDYLKKAEDLDNYSKIDYWASFKKTHEHGSGDCEDAALAIMALLNDNGYGSKVLVMGDLCRPCGHCVFLYEKNGKFGAGGINEEDWKLPVYNTIDELTSSFKEYSFYHVLDFSDSLESVINSDNELTGLFLYRYRNANHKFIND